MMGTSSAWAHTLNNVTVDIKKRRSKKGGREKEKGIGSGHGENNT